MQILQPINDHSKPVKITPDYAFQDAPKTKCLYHPQYIKHFCKEPSCLMPLCQECLNQHPPHHTRFIDSIESTLTQVYRGFAKQANEIATHQRGDIIQIRDDLHRLIDAVVEDVLQKSDQDYQFDLIQYWRNILKKIERLKDPNQCLKETILFFSEPDQGYHEPQLTYRGRNVSINYEALDQAKYHLNYLFSAQLDNGEYFFRPGERLGENPIRKVSRITYDPTSYQQIEYAPYNYVPIGINSIYQPIAVQPIQQALQPISQIQTIQPIQPIIYQPIQQQQQQPQLVQIIPQQQQTSQVQPIIQPLAKSIETPQPLVYYQESPIKTYQNVQPQLTSPAKIVPQVQKVVIPASQQSVQQQQLICTPQTIPSVYPVSPVQPFQTVQSSSEYAHPYPLGRIA